MESTRLLDLILYLTSNYRYTALDLADILGMTRRTVYHYIHTLGEYGFGVRKDGNCYSLDPRSPFFKRLGESIPLNDTEAEYLCHVLAENGEGDMMAARLRAKIVRHYGLDDIAWGPELTQRLNTNKAQLRQAMKTERIAKICGYSSPHSHTVRDRYVEPFLWLNNGRDVRCHEITTHQNKTFKLSRMASVELLDDSWFNKPLHKQVYTDIFMFSGEERHRVSLRLGLLSRNLMIEEYPLSEPCVKPDKDKGHWIMELDVASFLGIGRFVMGLYEDIEVLGDDDFREYITKKVGRMSEAIASRPEKEITTINKQK